MKKFVTLMLALGAVTISFAQTSRDEARRVILGGNGGNTSSSGKYPPTQQGRDVILGGGNNQGNYPTHPGQYPQQEPQRRTKGVKGRGDCDRDENYGRNNGDYRSKQKGNNGKHKGWYKNGKNKD